MIRLLALDIDGTLLRRDGAIDPRDRDAIARARDAGLIVTLCTGRIYSGTRAIAEELRIEHEMVCADGSSVMCARTGRRVEAHPLTADETTHLLDLCAPSVAPFLLSDSTIHHDARGQDYLHYVRGWSPSLREHARIVPDEEMLMGVAIGPKDDVLAVADQLRKARGDALLIVTFPSRRAAINGAYALLIRRGDKTKGSSLLGLAGRLGLRREDLAAVGDWWNDVALFEAVGRSFAMGQAPDGVASSASARLGATDETGGGVAEAVRALLED